MEKYSLEWHEAELERAEQRLQSIEAGIDLLVSFNSTKLYSGAIRALRANPTRITKSRIEYHKSEIQDIKLGLKKDRSSIQLKDSPL